MNYFSISDPTNVVSILKDDKNFVHLSDGTMVKKDKFLGKYQPVLGDTAINESVNAPTTTQTNTQQPVANTSSDEVDPASFFSSSAVSGMADTFKNADSNQFNEQRQTNVIKNGVPSNTQNSYQTQQPQQQGGSADGIVTVQRDPKMDEIEQLYENEKYAFGEEVANKRRLGRIAQHQGIGQKPKDANTQVNVNNQEQTNTTTVQPQEQVDPSEMMFKSFKRNYNIDINITIKDKIANPDFVKMMMENMEGDIIGYYKKIIMNNIMGEIHIIEKEVENSIKTAIYGDDIPEEESDEKGIDIIIDDGGISDENNTDLKIRKEAVDVANALQEHVDNGGELDILIEGKPTKTGKKTFKFINDKDKVVDMLPETAKKKGYKPYIKEDK